MVIFSVSNTELTIIHYFQGIKRLSRVSLLFDPIQSSQNIDLAKIIERIVGLQ